MGIDLFLMPYGSACGSILLIFTVVCVTIGTMGTRNKSVETTMIYTHVVSQTNKAKVISPLDF